MTIENEAYSKSNCVGKGPVTTSLVLWETVIWIQLQPQHRFWHFLTSFGNTSVVFRYPLTTDRRALDTLPPLGSTLTASVFWSAQSWSVFAALQCNPTALVQDCIQKAKQLSDLEEQVPNKSEFLMYFSGIRRCEKGRWHQVSRTEDWSY